MPRNAIRTSMFAVAVGSTLALSSPANAARPGGQITGVVHPKSGIAQVTFPLTCPRGDLVVVDGLLQQQRGKSLASMTASNGAFPCTGSVQRVPLTYTGAGFHTGEAFFSGSYTTIHCAEFCEIASVTPVTGVVRLTNGLPV